jgi:ribosomal-protein-alanine N-acetyltransferase
MARIHGWSATLTEPNLLDGPVVLRPMRISNVRACLEARAANDSWLRPWDASNPGGELPPSLVKRFVSAVRQAPFGSYATAIYSRFHTVMGIAAYWVIWYDGQLAGQLNVFRIAWGPLRSAEVGYWIDEHLAGRGIGPTALAMAIDHSFLVMHLHRLEACIQPENFASRRAVEKLGFRDEGLRVRQVHINGAWRDHICYGITAEEVPDGLLPRWRSSMVNPRPILP